jgi:hypothetical protein
MEMELISIVQSVGFPIAISVWFMLRTEKCINNNTKALIEVKENMVLCHTKK